MKTPFAYLNVHSLYSIGNSFIAPHDYVKAIQTYNDDPTHAYYITGLGLAEDGLFNSSIKLHQACEPTSIQPIYGVEIYHESLLKPKEENDLASIYLIAKNEIGLQNLNTIVSEGGLNRLELGDQLSPFVGLDFLMAHGEGIIATSSGLTGQISRDLIGNMERNEVPNPGKAGDLALMFQQAFDEFYVELQPHDTPEQLLLNQKLVELGKSLNIPLVMTTHAYYLTKEDRVYHDVLRQMGKRDLFKMSHELKTPEELEHYCRLYSLPLDCLTNTVKIASQCQVSVIPASSRQFLPAYPVPSGYSEETYLRRLVNHQLQQYLLKHPEERRSPYFNQINYELDVICHAGFSGYFLIIWGWLRWCRKQGILIGPGRGSAAGSLVAYLLNITKLNPLHYQFVFERFMNPERVSFPDIDVDIDSDRRGEAIQYFTDTYGKDYVSQIITYSRYQLKSTLQKVNSTFNYLSSEEMNKLTKSLPGKIGEDNATYDLIKRVALAPQDFPDLKESEIKSCQRSFAKLQKLFESFPEFYQALHKLNGAIRSTGLHAGGVVVSKLPLTTHLPLLKAKGGTAILPIIQYEMEDIEAVHLLKIDALGLNNLGMIRRTMELANLPMAWYEDEEVSDSNVYQMLQRGQTTDIFQLSAYQATRMIRDFNVRDFLALIAVIAGNRPGPLATIEGIGKSMVDLYIQGYKNPLTSRHYHPTIDPILNETYGCLWYQEHLILIGQVMAGYSLGSADTRIRKVVSKKKRELLVELRNEFIYGKQTVYNEAGEPIGLSDLPSPYCKGAVPNGYDEGLAIEIFNIIEKFGNYGFNKSHSGTYALLAYKTAWLSCYYPVEYAIACLTSSQGNLDKVLPTITLCRKRGITILPPSLNHSKGEFSLEIVNGKKAIRFGLLAVKGISHASVDFILACRERGGMIQSLDDYFRVYQGPQAEAVCQSLNVKMPLNGRAEPNLVLCGVFDDIESNRYQVMNTLNMVYRQAKDYKPYDVDSFDRKKALELEQEYLSTYISQHPLDPYPYVDLMQVLSNQTIETAGILVHFENAKQSNGQTYGKAKFELKDGSVLRANFFGDSFQKFRPTFTKKKAYVLKGPYKPSFKSVSVNQLTPIKI